ncbi:MAG: GNAT family N-acetyltransferase [Acidobacteria bacterium]|nr:GNAT family N-acetyltransferase [Acidobacteriota bacterium]
MELSIRLANRGDSEAIADVLLAAFSLNRAQYTPEAFVVVTPVAAEIETRFVEGPIWVAELDGVIVGTVSLTTEPEGLYIRSMAVRPEVQGIGIGHKLLDAVDDFFSRSKMDRIFLYTTYFVTGAKEMYEKHGFKWVRDTTAEEWYGTPGLEMDKRIEQPQSSQNRGENAL